MRRMMIFTVLLTLILSPIPIISSSEGSPPRGEVLLKIISSSPERLILLYEAPPPTISPEGVPTYPGLVSHSPEGCPLLPHLSRYLIVGGGGVSVVVRDVSWREMRVGEIPPSPPPLPDSVNSTPSPFKGGAYFKDEFTPGLWAEIPYTGYFRQYHLALLTIHPVQYNPVRGVIRYATEILVEVRFSGPLPSPPTHPDVARFLKGISMNWPWNTTTSPPPPASSGAEYLIISHPTLLQAAHLLAQWKVKEGYVVKVVSTVETGNTSLSIRRYLERAYREWNPSPIYVLLLGDADLVPTNYFYRHPYHGTPTGTDLWYSTVSGSDFFPDIFIGRIPANNLSEALRIVKKEISYRATPPSNLNFYHNVTVAAYFQDGNRDGYEDRRFVRTSEEIRDHLLSLNYTVRRVYYTPSYVNPTHYNNGYYGSGEPLPPSLLRSNGFAWDGSSEDITAAVMNGTLILNHRDHGARWGWGEPYYTSSDAYSLKNGNLTPLVFTINCQTGWFDHETDPYSSTQDECFSEQFLSAPGGGAVGVFGASRVSYSGYNDFLALGFYDALFPSLNPSLGSNESLNRMGEVLAYGKMYMLETWGDGWGLGRLEFELFHFFGDPALRLWLEEPKGALATCPENLTVGTTEIRVLSPSEGATVTLSRGEHLYGRAHVVGGVAVIRCLPLTEGEYNLTVVGENYTPYIRRVVVREGEVDAPLNLYSPEGPVRGDVDLYGYAGRFLSYTILDEDFEGETHGNWSFEDVDHEGGEDFWGLAWDRQEDEGALWSAGSGGVDDSLLFREDFESGDGNWSFTSHTSYTSPWSVVSTPAGHVLRSTGGVREMKEEARLRTPINTTSVEHLRITFNLTYQYGDGGEYFELLISPDNASWESILLLREPYSGEVSIDLENNFTTLYLAFIYHATYDGYVEVDNITVWGGRRNVEVGLAPGGISSVAHLFLDLSLYDSGMITCRYHTAGSSRFNIFYRDEERVLLRSRLGYWSGKETFEVPAETEEVLFIYEGGGDEGVYIDHLTVEGLIKLKSLELLVDGEVVYRSDGWNLRYILNTTALPDGEHNLTLRAVYSEGLKKEVSRRIVSDNTPPRIGPPLTPTVGQGEECEIGAYVRDNMGLKRVWIEIEGKVINLNGSAGVYTCWQRFASVGTYRYTLYAEDDAGNIAEATGWVNVTDTEAPIIHLHYGNIVQGERWHLSAEVEDNIGVEAVWLNITGETFNLTGGPEYNFSKVFLLPGEYTFSLFAADREGNVGRADGLFVVVDTQPPLISIPEVIEAVEDEPLQVNFTVTDLSEVVRVEFLVEGVPVVVEDSHVNLLFEDPGVYSALIEAYDSWGNVGEASVKIAVKDETPPQAVMEGPEVVDYLSTASYSALPSRDNAGISEYIWGVEGPGVRYEVRGEKVIRVNFTALGIWRINLTVVDLSAHYSSTVLEVECRDLIPPRPVITLKGGPIYEGEWVNLSAKLSYDNVAITNYTWIFVGDNVTTLYGECVRFNFTTSGTWRVTLRVRDPFGNSGEAEIELQVERRPLLVKPQRGERSVEEEGSFLYYLLIPIPYVLALLLYLLYRRREEEVIFEE